MRKRAVFLDRDGIVNKVKVIKGKPYSPRTFKNFKIYAGIKNFIKKINNLNFLTIIITNQPDLARKKMNKKELQKMFDKIREELNVDDIYCCPHDDKDKCSCRKPNPGMILSAAKKHKINLSQSYFVGDTERDIKAAKKSGCTGILLEKKYNKNLKSVIKCKNFSQIIAIMENDANIS